MIVLLDGRRLIAAAAVAVLLPALALASPASASSVAAVQVFSADVPLVPVATTGPGATTGPAAVKAGVTPQISYSRCQFYAYADAPNSSYSVAIASCTHPVIISNLIGYANWTGSLGQPVSDSTNQVSSGGYVSGLQTGSAYYFPSGSTIKMGADLDPGPGWAMQNIECVQTGGHTFHCVSQPVTA